MLEEPGFKVWQQHHDGAEVVIVVLMTFTFPELVVWEPCVFIMEFDGRLPFDEGDVLDIVQLQPATAQLLSDVGGNVLIRQDLVLDVHDAGVADVVIDLGNRLHRHVLTEACPPESDHILAGLEALFDVEIEEALALWSSTGVRLDPAGIQILRPYRDAMFGFQLRQFHYHLPVVS